MKKLGSLIALCALAAGFAVTAAAQNSATKEVGTAHTHALLAQRAGTLAMAHTHLHHVINCLVGPQGAGFDAAAGTPCKGEGNGAIPDSASNHALHAKLQAALADARTGLKSDSLASAHRAAAKAAAALQQKASGAYSW